MDARTAAGLLGGRARGNRVQCPGPNHGKHDQSLTVIFTVDGFIVHSFANDDWQACKDYVRTRLGIAEDWKPDPAKFKAEADPDGRNFEFAMEIWKQAQSPFGTLVERYLATRKLALPSEIECIRYHPSLKYDGARYPAMVALYRDIITDEPCGVHRTFLDPETARKIDRRMLASSKGAAIKLDPNESVTMGLAIGEGIETCLAARQHHDIAPAWALMSAQGIANFPVLSGVDCLTLLEERDESRTNERACKEAMRRWLVAGREVIHAEPLAGKDANDALIAKQRT